MNPRVIAELRAIVGADGIFTERAQLRTYETDGLASWRQVPEVVVLPTSTRQVQGVVRVCHREHIPFVPRGSGTGLSGGALPVPGCVVIGLSRMRQILDVDPLNQRIVVQPDVINLWVTQRVAPDGFYYAPDPSSQQVCSIGGRGAENAGGGHRLKEGFNVNHVLGLKVVVPDGDVGGDGGPLPATPGLGLHGGPRGFG